MKGEWISVKDSLPPFNHYVLIYDDGCHIGSLWSYESIGQPPEWWSIGGNNLDPTHWMELPERPA